MSVVVGFELIIGAQALHIPAGAGKLPSALWAEISTAVLLEAGGYERIARDTLGRVEAWLRAPLVYQAFPGEEVVVEPRRRDETIYPKRWVVLRVTPRQEGFVHKALTEHELKLQAYVPLHVTVPLKAKRKATRTRPLIPGYVFALLPDEDALDVAMAIRGVLEIMCDGEGRPRQFPLRELGGLIIEEACHAFDESWEPPAIKGKRYSHRWVKGERIRIDGGTFHDFEGEVTATDRKDRIRVSLALFGRWIEVEVETRDVRAIA